MYWELALNEVLSIYYEIWYSYQSFEFGTISILLAQFHR